MKQIISGIVLYNPDLDLFEKCLKSIHKQVEEVIIVDNHSENIEKVLEIIKKYDNTNIIINKENFGIAKGLNQICEYSQKQGYDWILTLDQDSICPNMMIKEMVKYTNNKDIAIICPKFENNTIKGGEEKVEEKTSSYIDLCITSGSLMSIEKWNEVGRFDEWMFIDCVDYDICLKMKKNNYKILQINTLVLKHHVGEGKIKKFLGREITIYNHSVIRNYYFVRNYIYIIRKYFKLIHPIKRIIYILLWEIKKLFFEPNKKEILFSAYKGLKDGLKKK